MKKVIFVDFDGTITKTDTVTAMVEAFAKEGWKDIEKLWEDKKISTKDCANGIFKLFDASLEDVRKLINKIEIDDCFKEFLALCKDKGYQVYILSDGYDFNIETILKKYDIEAGYYSNKLLYDTDKGFSIERPYSDGTCKSCGTCKKDLINELKGDSEQVIYIGDGHSDMCPVMIADIVFAKGVLYRYCKDKGVKATQFSSFKHIISFEL